MKKILASLLALGIIANVILLIYFDEKFAAYGSVIFWGIGLIGMLNYGANIFKLSNSVKRTKSELYKKHSYGMMITRSALSNKEFLSALNDQEQGIIEDNRTIFKFLLICFGLFTISAFINTLI